MHKFEQSQKLWKPSWVTQSQYEWDFQERTEKKDRKSVCRNNGQNLPNVMKNIYPQA